MMIGEIKKQEMKSLFMGDPTKLKNNNEENPNKVSKLNKGSIYAKDITVLDDIIKDPVKTGKEKAQKQAFKLVSEQFARDKKVDDNLQASRLRQQEFAKEAGEAEDEIKSIRDMKQALNEEYGITADSEEYQNLELLERSINDPGSITDEDWQKLKDMGPLTDYQKEMLRYNGMEKEWKKLADRAYDGVKAEGAGIRAVKQELLKSDPMLDIQKQAAEIMKAASKAAIGMIYDQAKENIDEKLNEEIEKSDKLKKEEEKNDSEELKEAKEDNIDEEILHNILESQKKLEEDLKELKEANNLLDEDLKGIAMDQIIW